MKILQKILSLIGMLLFLFVAFIVYSNFNPSISQTIGDFIKENQNSSTEQSDVSGNMSPTSDTTLSETQETAGNTAENLNSDTGSSLESDNESSDGLALPATDNGYVAPSKSELDIPSDVSDRAGYVPVEDTGEEISDSDAESLQEQYGTGDLGENLTFDETIYPYYAMLDDDSQSLYRQIYANITDFNTTFAPVVQTTPSSIKNAFTAVSNDHPELFWLNTQYTYQYMPDGSAAVLTLSFNETADDYDVAKTDFDTEVASLISEAQTMSSDYEKEIAAHDALIDYVTYNKNAAMSQSAYSGVVYGETVCAGYAKAFQYMMQKLGVPCYYCTGYAGENHAWNIIKLDDGYYNVDTTWDDTDPSSYNYFNCSDTDFETDHIRTDLSVNLPACEGEIYRRLLVDSTDGTTATGKSLSEAGFSEEDVLTDLTSYYQDCLTQLEESDSNPVTFDNVISDETLLQEVSASYNNGDYKEAYGNQIVIEKGASTMNLSISIEQLQDGYYLLSHTFTFA